MSTRSGKRRHNSFLENVLKPEVEQVTESVKKRKSSRLKENVEEFSVAIAKNKKRTNYVTYPTANDEVEIDADSKENEGNYVRVLRKNALREQNLVASTVSVEPPTNIKKPVRTTRRTQKLAEDTRTDIQETQSNEGEASKKETQKSKHGKKKKRSIPEAVNEEIVIPKKNTKKKGKKVKKSGSMIVEDIEPQNDKRNSLNRSMSVDSFHSAAGSPCNNLEDNSPFNLGISSEKQSEKVNTTYDKNSSDQKLEYRRTRSTSRLSGFDMSLNNSNKIVKESRKRKSSAKDLDIITLIDDSNEREKPINNSISRVLKKHKSSIVETVSEDRNTHLNIDREVKNSTYDLEDLEKKKLKRSFASDIDNSIKSKSILLHVEISDETNTTYDKDDILEISKSVEKDIIVDKNRLSDDNYEETDIQVVESAAEKKIRQSTINTTFEKSLNNSQINTELEPITQMPEINTTFEKDSDTDTNVELFTAKPLQKNAISENLPPETCSDTPIDNKSLRKSILTVSSQKETMEMNTTYDKIEKSDSTYDKDKNLDATFDKGSKSSLVSSDSSNVTMDKSGISITSDDSTENIINTTPVLIESSFDDSLMNASKATLKSPEAPMTPLKREGTFTKDGPEVETPKAQVLKTPTKRMSLPSPGCTPFHPTESASKEKSMANITRSLEKSRRSSLAEPLPRTTKVMFCSPINNPAVVLQQRRKVIKSNLKGSNKSFVIDDNVAPTESRPAPRKRSYTQSDAEDARVKRKRLVDGLQHSVDRLSRARTASASAKLPDPGTPTKKPITPKKIELKISRTKLPNFAALHQKEFDKMESLNECQERRARRAKRLLTPTGGVAVLERSPKENEAEPEKSPSEPRDHDRDQTAPKNEKHSKEPVKPETPVKSLPTLKSLNSGYTRFGFKLNLDANPFSVPTKSDTKNLSMFNFSNKKDSKVKTKLFTFSSRKDKGDNTKPLDIRSKFNRPAILPSLAGNTSVRKEAAKQAVMREKSFTDRRNTNRNENRTIIKGVRTNRRFDLQMRMRNID